ncbi:RcnB family protein [Hephaestia mangrovi]|uniref:RcnB family protein n=1 Tax=Hephaestia mangrovi TaxID=2873268 RepID=UPI001CA6A4BE|nr:RcnB family protein [Hephaestia mangrovi]MBY8826924.1 RcnB family protein [Hephaestia mangrovi]
MRLSLLAALAAATALIPAAASAQNHDRGSWHGDRGDRGGNRGERGGNRPASPARPNTGYAPAARPSFQPGNRPQTPPHFDRNQMARPEVTDRAQQYRRPDAPRPTQARPGGNWHAQAGGSHFGDRPDRNDWNRGHDRPDRNDWNRDHDRSDHGNWDRDRDHADRGNWNRDRGSDQWHRAPGRSDGRWGNYDRGRRGAYDHDWRRDNRYDWRDYRVRHRSVYRLPRYYAPYGWDYGYRRFGIGFRLDSILFGSNYWISDPYYYRLPPAYGPYRWVRYYNDALLVDIDTGEVVDVVYDIFW